eukprot:scaffold842_cov227-Pinguiococcus_pyrenoidosus.AAC.1
MAVATEHEALGPAVSEQLTFAAEWERRRCWECVDRWTLSVSFLLQRESSYTRAAPARETLDPEVRTGKGAEDAQRSTPPLSPYRGELWRYFRSGESLSRHSSAVVQAFLPELPQRSQRGNRPFPTRKTTRFPEWPS